MNAIQQTDKRLKEIEAELKKIYKTAQKEITAEWTAYMNAQNAYVKDLQEAYKRAKLYGTDAEAREVGRQLGIAKAERTLQNQHYKDMVNDVTDRIARANQTALSYVNNEMPWFYTINYNQAARDLDKVGMSFTLIDEGTVKRRVMDGDIKLPKKKLNVPKDKAWNTKKLNSEVLQGIVNGESMDKIADRILPVVDNNMSAAIRNARTMVTGAQNQGRQDSYDIMTQNGIVMKKVWIATPDERTRESHLMMDGEEVDPEQEFSNGLRFPGDPSGVPEEVYNCRCTMITNIIGFKKADGRIERIDYTAESGLHEQQIEEERDRREKIAAERQEQEKQKQAESSQTYKSKIEEIQRYVEKDGVTTEHVLNAGKAMQEEVKETYDKWQNDINDAKAAYEKAYQEQKEYSKLYDVEFDRRFNDMSLFDDKEYLEKVRNMELTLDDMRAKSLELNTKYWEAINKTRGDAPAEFLKEKLAEVREVGAKGINFDLHFNKSKSDVRKNIEYAYDKYPSSWVQKSVDRSTLKPRKVSRGYYSDYRSEICISGHNKRMRDETAIHELGHRFERAVPEIKEQEKLFYEKRTAGLPLEWLGRGYDRHEVSRKDDFISPYMGKDYGGSAYELVSMGFEYAYMEPLQLAKDPEMQQWILGLLAIVP